MATTPNFNWSTPDNTGLVKNGALDIRTLGNSIDSSMAELKGGTTGQVLAKASGTDMDFSWVTDATGIPATIFDAKGDIIAATAADTASRLAVGTNGQVLTADSTAATGLKWATPAAGSTTFAGCMLRKTANQSISTSTYTAITFNSEVLDTDSYHNNSTNTERITIPTGKGGKYMITAVVHYSANANNSRRNLVTLNGAVGVGTAICDQRTGGFSGAASEATFVGFYSLAAGDFIQLNAFQDSGSTLDALGDPNAFTYFGVQYLGA